MLWGAILCAITGRHKATDAWYRGRKDCPMMVCTRCGVHFGLDVMYVPWPDVPPPVGIIDLGEHATPADAEAARKIFEERYLGPMSRLPDHPEGIRTGRTPPSGGSGIRCSVHQYVILRSSLESDTFYCRRCLEQKTVTRAVVRKEAGT